MAKGEEWFINKTSYPAMPELLLQAHQLSAELLMALVFQVYAVPAREGISWEKWAKQANSILAGEESRLLAQGQCSKHEQHQPDPM